MKRSEMVKQIAKELRAQSSGNTDIDSDQLLSVIEALGMVPPEIERDMTQDEISQLGFDDGTVFCHQWEKE